MALGRPPGVSLCFSIRLMTRLNRDSGSKAIHALSVRLYSAVCRLPFGG